MAAGRDPGVDVMRDRGSERCSGRTFGDMDEITMIKSCGFPLF